MFLYFEQLEGFTSPLLGERRALDRDGISPVVDRFYGLHGWAVETGWPAQDHLRELDLEGVHRPIVAGAAGAWERGVT